MCIEWDVFVWRGGELNYERQKGRTVQTAIHTAIHTGQAKAGRAGTPLLGKGQLDFLFHPLPSHHSNSFLLPRVCNASQLLLTTCPFHEGWGYPQPVPLCTHGSFIVFKKGSSLNSALSSPHKPEHQVLKYTTPRNIQATKKARPLLSKRGTCGKSMSRNEITLPALNQL